MSLTNEDKREQFATNGVTTDFALPFTIFQDEDVSLYYLETDGTSESLLTLDVDYSIDALTTVQFTTAPASGILTMIRNTEKTQERDVTAGSAFNSVTIENAMDKLTMMAHELVELKDRIIQTQKCDDHTQDLTLPLAADRASGYLGFDASGSLTILTALVDEASVSAYMETLLLEVSAAAALTNLGVSAFIQTLIDDADAATARETLGVGGNFGTMHLRYQQASTVVGGAATATAWTLYPVNTEVDNTISGASIASSVITLPAGTYDLEGHFTFYRTGDTRIRVYDNDGAAVIDTSINHYSSTSVLTSAAFVELETDFTLSAETDIQIEYYVDTNSSTEDLGKAQGITDTPEIYGDIKIKRTA